MSPWWTMSVSSKTELVPVHVGVIYSLRDFFSNQVGRSQLNILVSIVFCCIGHRNNFLSDFRCSQCTLYMCDDGSLLDSLTLGGPFCAVCHDKLMLKRMEKWIDLRKQNPMMLSFNAHSHVIPIGSRRHLPPSLISFGKAVEEQDLKEKLQHSAKSGMSRALLVVGWRTDDEKLEGVEPEIEVYADSGLIADPRVGGDRRLNLTQEIWRHGHHVIRAVCTAVFLVAFFKFMVNDLANRPSFSSKAVNFGASLKQSQQQTTSVGFLILVAASMIVTGLIIFVCWWRFRMQWERIFAMILGVDFMVIMALGGSVLSFIFLQWSGLSVDYLTYSVFIWNFAFVGSAMLYIRGDFLDYFVKMESLQRNYLVVINSVMATMVTLTLSRYLVIGFISLPVMLELIEIWRNVVLNRAGLRGMGQFGFLWLTSVPGRATTSPIIFYEVPNSLLRMRAADLMWMGLLASIPEKTIIASICIVLGCVFTISFLIPYIDVNRTYPHLTITFFVMALYSPLESAMLRFSNSLVFPH
eukprot:TRINITY_DN35499_c0_g2_i1.p1 TRINITY_DN35499_c0_g2~~TRINITY_DN35499_c0_g2_i1.p1  ORF type:complete len:524 (+),score=101.31 TRINITY_DN35499_c0_g2_i1:733-2304(+)